MLTIDLRVLAGDIWARRRALLRFYLAVLVLTAGSVLLLPRWYRSSVTLVPAPRDGLALDWSGAAGGLAGATLGLAGTPTAQDQLRMVVTSRAVADSVIRHLDLRRRWGLDGFERAREELARRTRVVSPREGQLVVSVEARTAGAARALAAAYARYAASEALRLKSSLAGQRRRYLDARLDELDREIAAAGERVRRFEEEHGAVALGEQTRETVDAAAALQTQAALLETELAGVRRYFTEQTPEVSVLRARLVEIGRQTRRLAGGGGPLQIESEKLPALKQENLRLMREQSSLMTISELLRRVYEQARVEESNPVATFSVLDAPELPERHARPRRGLTVAIVMALAVIASAVWVYRETTLRPAPLARHGPHEPATDDSRWREIA